MTSALAGDNQPRSPKTDGAIFTAWCQGEGVSAWPASGKTLARFIDVIGEQEDVATVRRYVSNVATLHRIAGLDNPASSPEAKLALRRLTRANGTHRRQAAPPDRRAPDVMRHHLGDRLIDRRDAAMLALAQDALARCSELVALAVEDFTPAEDGSATILIRKRKTGQSDGGTVRRVVQDTAKTVAAWIAAAGLTHGALFRAVGKSGAVGDPLEAGGVASIVKRTAARAGIDASSLSGRQVRVGGWMWSGRLAHSERLLAKSSSSAKPTSVPGRPLTATHN